MNAIRQIVEVKNHRINIELPKDFDAETVEVIIFNRDEADFSSLPDSFYDEMEKRRTKHFSGESKSYTWEEVKTRISAERNAF